MSRIIERYIESIPGLRNRRYRDAFLAGREKRIAMTLSGRAGIDSKPSRFSHNATFQSYFRKGWYSVTETDIRLAELEG